MRKTTLILPLIVVLLVVILSAIFIVDEREKALVLQFGQIKQVKEEPGLGFKIPLVQNVVRYDDRILSLDTEPIEVTPSDDRRLVVDAFARYRIADVVNFREALGAGGIAGAESRLGNILNAQVRAVLGSEGVTSNTILSEERTSLMNRIRDEAREEAMVIGLDVIDVRLKQTNLPEQNLDATFARMRAEREREAADEIARGKEAAQRVRALADRTVVELVSEAEREAEITRGEADARRSGIYADAFTRDEEFFEFYRSLSAYQNALQQGNSTLVLSPDGEFFNYLRSPSGRSGASASVSAGTSAPAGSDSASGSVTGASGEEAASDESTTQLDVTVIEPSESSESEAAGAGSADSTAPEVATDGTDAGGDSVTAE